MCLVVPGAVEKLGIFGLQIMIALCKKLSFFLYLFLFSQLFIVMEGLAYVQIPDTLEVCLKLL